jgi:predicted MFS family arabinose efflux permease
MGMSGPHQDSPVAAQRPAAAGLAAAGQGIAPGLVRLMAAACAVTVANIYYAQPLLHAIGSTLHASQTAASLLVTAGQAGYAAGLLLIVPAGEIVRRRPLVTALLAVCSLSLAASAAAPGLAVLGAMAALTGATSVVVQMLVPYAATLASDNQRSRVIGTLVGGVLIGILLSRTFAGIVAQAGGWRMVYAVAAGLMVLTTVVLRRALPDHPRQLDIRYRDQMAGVLAAVRSEPVLRWRSLLAACGFGAFSCFWTTVTFLLAGPGFGFSQLEIGLFALVGAAGAVSAMALGRVLDTWPGLRWPATGAAFGLMAGSFVLIGIGGTRPGAPGLGLLVVGVLLMDACVQAAHVANQSVIYGLLPEARSRLTTVYITTMFLGGAVGSVAGARAYQEAGWTGATLAAACFPLLGLLFWLAGRRAEISPRE